MCVCVVWVTLVLCAHVHVCSMCTWMSLYVEARVWGQIFPNLWTPYFSGFSHQACQPARLVSQSLQGLLGGSRLDGDLGRGERNRMLWAGVGWLKQNLKSQKRYEESHMSSCGIKLIRHKARKESVDPTVQSLNADPEDATGDESGEILCCWFQAGRVPSPIFLLQPIAGFLVNHYLAPGF